MTAIAVVGLHRGGTSAVAGVLHHLGVFMGDQLLEPSEHNPRGYFEDRRFVDIHTRILGGDWKFPEHDYMNNWGKNKSEYLSLVCEFDSKHGTWGVKDPRLCYTLPLLRIATGNTLDRVIVVWRDPWEAAQSLYERGGHTWAEAFEITMNYLGAMLGNTDMRGIQTLLAPRPPVLYMRFDELVSFPETNVSKLAEAVGLEVTQEAIDFLDRGLVHHTELMENIEQCLQDS